MLAVQEPLRFQPFLRPMVWGGRRLAMLGKELPTEAAYGECWEVSDHALHHSIVAAGAFAGQSLRDLMQERRAALLGSAHARHSTFPWLIKFLDAADWLSVQVHPDEAAVTQLWPGEASKTEAWLIIAAEPGSRIYAGLQAGVTRDNFRKAIAAGTVADCLHSFEPQAGQCVFLPAGTVHALGGGILLAEIQQTSDATFRLFDWNRRDAQGNARKLHIDEGLAAIHWQQGPVAPVQVSLTHSSRQSLVRCPYFNLDFLATSEPFEVGGMNALQAIIVLSGTARSDRQISLHAGETWIIPADAPALTIQPTGAFTCLLSSL